jgi:hypothetical protein
MREWGILEQEAKMAVESGDQEKIDCIKRRMNLLNPTFLVPVGEVSDVWKWCLENLNQPFRRWKPEDVSFYEKLSSESPSLPERARSAYAVWTLSKKHEFAQAAVHRFLEVARLYLSQKWFQEDEMIAFSLEMAAALSLKLNMKSPICFADIITEIARDLDLLDSGKRRGPPINSLMGAAGRLAQRVGSVKGEPALKGQFSRILELAFKLVNENPLNESYLEPCEPLSLTVGGLEAANKVKIMMAGSFVKQAEAQETRIARVSQLQQAMKLYSEVGNSEKLEECKLAVQAAMEEADERGEFKTITVKSGPIPVKNIVDYYLEKLSSKTPLEALDYFSHDISEIPTRAKIEESTRRSFSSSVGLSISNVIPFEGDLPKGHLTDDESKIQFRVDQNLAMASKGYEILRAQILKAVFGKIAQPKDLMVFLDNSANISVNSKKLIFDGIERHFSTQYTASISILIPQVEEILRTFLKRKGAVSSKFTTKDLGLQQRLVDDLLADAVGHLNQDLIDYLTVRMTAGPGGGGSNTRNGACHGWLPADSYTSELSWAVVDIILKLSVA